MSFNLIYLSGGISPEYPWTKLPPEVRDDLKEGICKHGGCLTSWRLPFPYNAPWFCISGLLSSNITPASSLAWLKASPQSHLMSKTSKNNTTIRAQLRMSFSLSRQCYQVSPPLRIHCAPYSNCMCHSGDSAHQGLNDRFWNLNRVIIQQHVGHPESRTGVAAVWGWNTGWMTLTTS